MKISTFLSVLFVVVLLVQTSFGQVATSGKITGKITDKESGQPLIGCNVLIENTHLGATTDPSGEYFILNVPVGTYTLKASMIGYQEITIKNVHVSAGFTTTQVIALSQSAVQVGEVVVQGTRLLIQRDQTNSTSITGAEEIKNLPLRGFEGVVQTKSGVVSGRGTDNNTFFTRGGRSNETVIFVDGFEQNNLLTGQSTVSVNGNSIQEVQTQAGGFSAEYGRALSGVVSVSTKEATPKYSAQFEAETDGFMGKESHGYNIYNLSLSGPLVPDYDKITLFLSGELKNLATSRATQGTVGRVYMNNQFQNWDKGYLPNDRNDGYTLQGKLTYRLSPTMKLNVNAIHSNFTKQTYTDVYKYNLDHSPWDQDKNFTVSGTLTYTLSNSTYMEVSAAYFSTDHFSGDGVYRQDFKRYQLEAGNDNPYNLYDPERGGFFIPEGWERYQGNNKDTTGKAQYLADNGLTEYATKADRYDPYGLYFAPGYARRFYQQYQASYFSPKVNIVSQLNQHHEIKVGFEYRYNWLSYYENREANLGTNSSLINAYGYTLDGVEDVNGNGGYLDGERNPFDISLFAQDKIEDEGLVVNAGIRFDFFNANTKSLKDEQDPLGANQVPPGDPRAKIADAGDFSETKTEQQISPRLGIAFPVTDKTVFHFNYGKFFQQSSLTDLYYGSYLIEFKALHGSPTYATQNPNLRPEQTTSYEVGLTQQMTDNVKFSVSAYYKDTKDLVNLKLTPTTAAGGASLYLLTNQDYGTIKGIDADIEIRRVGLLSGRLAYSLAFANGTGSQSVGNFNAVWLGYNTAKFTQPLDFDQRHTISANVDIRNDVAGGTGTFDNAGLNVLLTARSGFPYTPTEEYNAATRTVTGGVPKDNPLDGVNTRTGPWTFRIDLKLDKEINWGPFSTDVYIRVLNLLNTENILGVYQATGDAGSDGYLGSSMGANDARLYDTDNLSYTTGADYTNKYSDRLNGVDVNVNGLSQRKFDAPREVRLGFILSF